MKAFLAWFEVVSLCLPGGTAENLEEPDSIVA
jgi:hypothetical protein